MKKENKYLLEIPIEQQKWFNDNYSFVDNLYSNYSELWFLLKTNILGEDYRYCNYNGNSNDLISEYFMALTGEHETSQIAQYYLDTVECARMDAEEKEYFELARNIFVIINDIDKQILFIENENKKN